MTGDNNMSEPEFTEERIEVPFGLPSSSSSGAIVGTLTIPKFPSYPKSVVVIIHGFAGHRNYCYQKLLAHRLAQKDLGLYSFRFDFRGCGESAEIESPDGRTLDEDFKDIRDVTRYLREIQKLFVLALVAHSRGAIAALCYAARYDPTIPHLINCSGRFRTEEIRQRVARISPSWEEDGGYWMEIPRYLKTKRVWVPANETLSLATPDMTELAQLPNSTFFLTIYGLKDVIVAVKDSEMYANLLGDRHTLKFIPEADHNFYSRDTNGVRVSHGPEVTAIIAHWLAPDQRHKRFLDRTDHMTLVSRWKTVDGVVNFRDLGGWRNSEGCHVRTGFIFRAASLDGITQAGMKTIEALQVKKSFDLRSTEECLKNGIYEIAGLERVHAPLKTDTDMSPEEIAKIIAKMSIGPEGFLVVYKDLLNAAVEPYRLILQHIRDDPEKPFVIHCTAGKDRTGIICALILLLAGVDMHTVAREYELTTFGLRAHTRKIMKALERKETLDAKKIKNITSSSYETMWRAIEIINSEFGGAEGYAANHLGFTSKDIDIIKANILLSEETSSDLRERGFIHDSYSTSLAKKSAC